jgi:hypothetical protein
MRRRFLGGSQLVLLVVASAAAIGLLLAVPAAAGTLHIDVTMTGLGGGSENAGCPAGTPAPLACAYFSANGGIVRGLGKVSVAVFGTLDVTNRDCPTGTVKAVLTVGTKGTVTLSGPYADCTRLSDAALGKWSSNATIVGGTERFEGASGSGSLSSNGLTLRITSTLDVPGLTFDMNGPTLKGLLNRTIKATGPRGARVRYAVTAQDAVDGKVVVTCNPRSGSLFRIGKTMVRCSASDSSGNVTQRGFLVTVTGR